MVTAASSNKRALGYTKGLTRPKDVNAPARPLTAYFRWAEKNRKRVTKECNSTNVAEVTKKLGEIWRGLGDEDKSKYETAAKSDMEEYKAKLAEYKQTSEYAEYEKSLLEYNIRMTKKPFNKDPNMPKRPQSGYMLFAAEERPRVMQKNGDMKITEVMGTVAKAWKELSDAEKKPYSDKAKKLFENHAKEVEKYKATKEHAEYLEEKKAYLKTMEAKRMRLMKQAGMDSGKGSGATPKAKRPKKTSEPKKKKSNPKKKVSAKKGSTKKKASTKKKTSAKKTLKKSSAKKSSKKRSGKKK